MSDDKDDIISAQVVLRSSSGKSPGQSAITAENIADYTPSQDTAAKVSKWFAEAGFEVGSMVGNSFSITASAPTFEKAFDTKLHRDKKGGIQSMSGKGDAGYELPAPKLPKSIADEVEVVTFSRPPDFGPTNY